MTQDNCIVSQIKEYDEILDVRSPSEYAQDHIPGALNCPVLDDVERTRIGTLHQQESPFEARKQGAVLVARNIAQHIEQHFHARPPHWKPLVYCWRGGMRSRATVHILNSIGWNAQQLTGGYKAYRRSVMDTLEALAPQMQFLVLCGRTGVGKSRLLQSLRAQNAQVLDLEALANHRGSVLGVSPQGEQPSQKWFESSLCEALCQLDQTLPVYVEAESKRIGSVQLPEALMTAIRKGHCLRIEAEVEQRVAFLLDEYHHFIDDPSHFIETIQRLKPYIGGAQLTQWQDSFQRGQTSEVVRNLIEQYYDPLYLRSIQNNFEHYADADCIELSDITEKHLSEAACAIMNRQEGRSLA